MIIHQSLHGYDNGHRLLASSVELPRQAQKTLAILSDLSGPSGVPGFESYLTGYPLSGTDFFALACTWQATKQRRPGCVWTHTLLMGPEIMDSLADLSVLCHLFRRPEEKEEPFPIYMKAIDSNECADTKTPWHFDSEQSYPVLRALYNAESKPVLLPSDKSTEFSDLILAVWSEQWTSLRRSFTFSTGSLANRTLGNEPFQLQVVPREQIRSVKRSVKNAEVVDWHQPREHKHYALWLQSSAKHLTDFSGLNWEAHFRRIGKKLPSERSYFPFAAILANRERGCENENNPRSMLYYLIENLSSLEDGDKYFHLLADSCLNRSWDDFLGVSRQNVLEALSLKWNTKDIESTAFPAQEHIQTFVESYRDEASKLLSGLYKQHLSTFGEWLLERMANTLASLVTEETVPSFREAMPMLAMLNPSIGTFANTWKCPERQSYDIFDAITFQRDLSKQAVRDLIRTILSGGNGHLAVPTVRRFGSEALEYVLDWYNDSAHEGKASLSSEWRETLAANPSITLSWIVGKPRQLSFDMLGMIATYLDPGCKGLENVNTTTWLNALESHRNITAKETQDRVSAFVFVMGMRTTLPGAEHLMARTFGRVHDALMDNRLGDDVWDWLSPKLPHLGVFRYWDRAERLRKGIVEHFGNKDWPVCELAEGIDSPESWKYLVKICKKTRMGQDILSKLKNLLDQGNHGLSMENEKILKLELGQKE